MNDLTITLIQTDLHWESPDANRAMLEEKIRPLKNQTHVIVLPEMFTTGFSMNAGKLAEAMNVHTTRWMQLMAAHTGALVLGSVMMREGEHFFNRLIWMQPDGTHHTYDKRHTFRMANEHQTYSSGQQRLVAEWSGWRICPLICYDLRFPVWSRNQWNASTNRLDYDLLLYVASWPAVRTSAWDSLLPARAIENLSYVAGVNRVGKDGAGHPHIGHSVILDPKGQALHRAGELEEIITRTLSAGDLLDYRNRFPAWMDADRFTIGQ